MKLFVGFCIISFILCLLSCKEQKGYRALHEEYLEKNITRCADVLIRNQGYDTITARAKCACMLNAAFMIDSSYVKMEGKEMDAFFNLHRPKIESMCDSIKNHSKIE